ncbi:hypothetical protein E4P42_08060 [Mycobacterium sp. PS03-16]|nr:hypothetical protein E4P42_08060 [Mycobacterium sp. PS03-16]
MIKCNPHVTSLTPMVVAGAAHRSWCVADNYRSRLLRPGDRVLFWVSAHPQRGIWGAGRLTGRAEWDDGRLRVPVDIPLFGRPVTAAALIATGSLASLEVFRSPQQANPSWVDVDEIGLIDPLLPTAAGQL